MEDRKSGVRKGKEMRGHGWQDVRRNRMTGGERRMIGKPRKGILLRGE